MSESSRPVTLTASRCGPWQSAAGVVVATIFAVLVAPPETIKADGQQSTVVARVDVRSAGLISRDIVMKVENVSVPATAINAIPDIARNIAIVMDAGPDQARVLSKEKDLAIALINELSDAGTSFIIASVGASSKMQATTIDRSVAIEHIREITEDNGEKTNVPIYDAIGSAIRQIGARCVMQSCVVWRSQIILPALPRSLRTTVCVVQRASFDMDGTYGSSLAIPLAYF